MGQSQPQHQPCIPPTPRRPCRRPCCWPPGRTRFCSMRSLRPRLQRAESCCSGGPGGRVACHAFLLRHGCGGVHVHVNGCGVHVCTSACVCRRGSTSVSLCGVLAAESCVCIQACMHDYVCMYVCTLQAEDGGVRGYPPMRAAGPPRAGRLPRSYREPGRCTRV